MDLSTAIAGALETEGVGHVFALMGNANMELLVEIQARANIDVIHARHEGGAVAMADGYARATGDLGVATVTSGPGLVNAALSVAVAARRGVPLLVLAGDTAQGDVTGNQVMDQGPFVASLGAAYVRVEHESTAMAAFRRACRLARTSRRPVVLGVPANLQRTDVGTTSYTPSREAICTPAPLEPRADHVAEAAKRMTAARRPVILAGRGSTGTHDGLRELAARTGALLTTTLPALGAFDGDPFDVGPAGKISRTGVRDLLRDADCLLAVGASLNPYTTADGKLFADAAVITVDIADRMREGARVPTLHLQADANATVAALAEHLDPRPDPGYRTDAVRRAIEQARRPPPPLDRPSGADPVAVMQSLDAVLADDAAVLVGVGHFWYFPVAYLSARRRRFEFAIDFGAVGQTIPTAVGFAIGSPGRPVVAVEGDGGTLMNVQELDTAARHAANLTVVTLNDAGLGAEYHKLRGRGESVEGSVFPSPDLAVAASGLGVAGLALTIDDDPTVVLSRALATAPSLVDVRVDRDRVSEPYARTYFR